MPDTSKSERKAGHSRLVYDKATRTIVTVRDDDKRAIADPDFLTDLREFLANQEDADYDAHTGIAHPNDAMRLLTRLNQLFPEE